MGVFHYSQPFKSLPFAIKAAEKRTSDFVAIEKHHEFMDGYRGWMIDHAYETDSVWLNGFML